MEKQTEITPKKKVYSDRAIYAGTFLGGPMVAGYLIAQNYKALGQSNNARNSWIIATITSVVIFSSVIIVPKDDPTPSFILPLAYTILTRFLFKQYQEEELLEYASAGDFWGWKRTVGISILGAFITVSVAYVIISAYFYITKMYNLGNLEFIMSIK